MTPEEKAARRAAYKSRETQIVTALKEATGLPFLGNDAIGGAWVRLDDAEQWLSSRRAFNDPVVDCCGRDAADCDC